MTLLTVIGSVPAWHWEAACGDLGRLFASKEPEDIDEQRKVCSGCPVRANCAERAAAMEKGEVPDLVMAGLTKGQVLNGDLVDGERDCEGCSEVKLLVQFPKVKGKPGGRSLLCKNCVNAQNRAAYAARKTAAS
ncbi:WhiB family transcriptional regulator [Streptosporangium sp. CA-135522]|uniref:WhiB family transcriptional regulator n=1 Tax=Streptosporangium sp. CA-135522 TaxID=3240072 RepID=UPI003D8BBDB3